jgi:chromate transporter
VGGPVADLRADALTPTGRAAPTESELFAAFLRMTMLSFGGATAWVQRVLVDEKGWLTHEEFAEELALCQVLPGPNMTNIAVILGARFRGWRGALTAVTALIVPPAICVTVIAALFAYLGTFAAVRGALAGLAAAAAGLFVVLLFKLLRVLVTGYPREAWLIAAISFAAVAFGGLPLALVLVILGPVSIARAWRR